MSGLDVNTPRGRKTVELEERAITILWRRWPDCELVLTPKDKPAVVDGLITRDSKLLGIFETKCRDMTLERLQNEFNYEWLVTYEKLEKAAHIAKSLCVPLFGFLYLNPEDLVLVKKLSENGTWTATIRREVTTTQATVNGGTANRENAFIDMTSAKVLRP